MLKYVVYSIAFIALTSSPLAQAEVSGAPAPHGHGKAEKAAVAQKPNPSAPPAQTPDRAPAQPIAGDKATESPDVARQSATTTTTATPDQASASKIFRDLAGDVQGLTKQVADLNNKLESGTLVPSNIYYYLAVVALAAGFGGFVHGMTRASDSSRAISYALRLPFKGSWPLGFIGDFIVGSAAGTTIFFFMESVFGLHIGEFGKDSPQAFLKFVSLVVMCGYMGSHLLDRVALMIDSRLVKSRAQLMSEEDELRKAEERLKVSSEAIELVELATAYRAWKMYDEALNLYDQAIAHDPQNPHHYVQKSFVYYEQAKEAKDPDAAKALYEAATHLMQQVIDMDPNYARAYYDRACYRHLGKLATKAEVIKDLKEAFKGSDILRKMAKHDNDFKDLLQDHEFSQLILAPFEKTPADKKAKTLSAALS